MKRKMHSAQPQGHHGKTAAKKHRSDHHANAKVKSPGAKASRGSRLDKIKL